MSFKKLKQKVNQTGGLLLLVVVLPSLMGIGLVFSDLLTDILRDFQRQRDTGYRMISIMALVALFVPVFITLITAVSGGIFLSFRKETQGNKLSRGLSFMNIILTLLALLLGLMVSLVLIGIFM